MTDLGNRNQASPIGPTFELLTQFKTSQAIHIRPMDYRLNYLKRDLVDSYIY
jgi:hypothetical protein